MKENLNCSYKPEREIRTFVKVIGDLCHHDCYALHLNSTMFSKILKLFLILKHTKAAIFLAYLKE